MSGSEEQTSQHLEQHDVVSGIQGLAVTEEKDTEDLAGGHVENGTGPGHGEYDGSANAVTLPTTADDAEPQDGVKETSKEDEDAVKSSKLTSRISEEAEGQVSIPPAATVSMEGTPAAPAMHLVNELPSATIGEESGRTTPEGPGHTSSTSFAPDKGQAVRPAEAEYDEKHSSAEQPSSEAADPAQEGGLPMKLEIQTIMDQFANGAVGEEEVMSPRLERQQSAFVLPPRTSSLDQNPPRTSSLEHILSPQTTGQSIASQRSTRNGALGDTESLMSTKSGPIFQPPPPSPSLEPSLPFDFHRFLEQMRHKTADPVAGFLRSFLGEFGKKQWMVHEQVKIISDFLEFISKKMALCEVWRTASDDEFDNAKEGMEKLVMNRLYSQTFSPAIPSAPGSPRKSRTARAQADVASPHGPGRRGQHQEDVERDQVIAQKMRIYGWIDEQHLDIKPLGDRGKKFLGMAQQELLKINSYRAPRDKVICVLNCCKVIFGFLKSAKADQSADAFIPLLIYTVLRAKPENLVSNVQYIWRFRNQDKLGGEAGYYMSSLMGVVTFIENLDRTTITISDEDFERNVEHAVSAIAEENKVQEYEEKTHAAAAAATKPLQTLGEKSALSRPEVTSRTSLDAGHASPRRKTSQRSSEKSQANNSNLSDEDDDVDAVTGLLRTIQKPLSSIGRIFSDDGGSGAGGSQLNPASSSHPSASTPRRLSPAPALPRRPSAESGKGTGERQRSRQMEVEDSTARQASAEDAEAQRVRAREHQVVVETLRSMFPNLDRDVIEDVTRAQEGNVGRAVDACLALSA
ncbi:hypothetical protein LTR62_006093 [Meristemomyces frigidus]|uniref:Guanine nucleotide exchange factor Vps9 n=1 Tax=Meristemomyces frigidus TaxID=1508187 RepID=A0AAN7YN67_9PEZI|nr:hypothetical protein LTR62_006093 [Meristemomyces frigidus]